MGRGVELGRGCERKIEVFEKIYKINFFGGGGSGRWGSGGWGVGVWVGGARVDVIEELKFLVKFTKKKLGGGGGSGGGIRPGDRVSGGRVDVNAMLGVRGDVGYGGCKPRIEGIAQCTKSYCTILRKLKKCGGRGNI